MQDNELRARVIKIAKWEVNAILTANNIPPLKGWLNCVTFSHSKEGQITKYFYELVIRRLEKHGPRIVAEAMKQEL